VDNQLSENPVDHLQAIRVFARVVETGGFNRAALSLGMPNATASKLIQSLETHLQVKLLERSTRRVSVTLEGAAYYERTRALLSDLDDLEATLGQPQASPRGSLRVDTGGAPASGLLIPALPGFCARYPNIQLQLGVTDRTTDLIAENIDCAIRSVATDPALITQRLGALHWTTCASPAYLAAHAAPTHPRQILRDGHTVASYFSAHTGLIQPMRFLKGGESLAIEKPHSIVQVNESNAHLATALAGFGIVQTLDFMVRPSIDRGSLVPMLEDWRRQPLDVYVVYAPSRRYSTKVRVFVEWIKELFAGINRASASA
jgi:DNA-binding transcriptional LysR family regulator